jgi:hypothetical protein
MDQTFIGSNSSILVHSLKPAQIISVGFIAGLLPAARMDYLEEAVYADSDAIF